MKRRDFIRCLTIGSGAGIVTTAFANNSDIKNDIKENDISLSNIYGSFTHGVASGDPLSNKMIIWSRFVPDLSLNLLSVPLKWEMATNKDFTKNRSAGEIVARKENDFIVKVDVVDLKPNTRYFYRFSIGVIHSNIGMTKTLPLENISKIRLAVATCANHPAGYFNAYKEISVQHSTNAFDALVHLGDYIYEYGMGEYATTNSVALDRVPSPSHECITLEDYRKRYAQYRSDSDLQSLHAEMPFIHIWDDHEIADNSWSDGALNHQPNEGKYKGRREAAVQAFHEWLPIRNNAVDKGEIYRSFKFGDLVHLLMLDTRVSARTKQLEYANYNDPNPEKAYADLQKDMYSPNHHLLGEKQKKWLKKELNSTNSRWTVLGQQVLMTKMDLPFNLLRALMGAKEAKRTRTVYDGDIIMDAARNPSILKSPYNLDAWDAYPRDRDWLYHQMKQNNKSFVSFAGDTHNAWAGQLTDKTSQPCGIEFASAALGSPGMESYLPLPPALIREIQKLFPMLVTDLKWANIVDRGFMAVTFTHSEVQCDWIFVDNILQKEYKLLPKTTAITEDCLDLEIKKNPNQEKWEEFLEEVEEEIEDIEIED